MIEIFGIVVTKFEFGLMLIGLGFFSTFVFGSLSYWIYLKRLEKIEQRSKQ